MWTERRNWCRRRRGPVIAIEVVVKVVLVRGAVPSVCGRRAGGRFPGVAHRRGILGRFRGLIPPAELRRSISGVEAEAPSDAVPLAAIATSGRRQEPYRAGEP